MVMTEPTAPGGEVRAEPDRVASLIASMTIEEKLAQLVGLWTDVDAEGDDVVAPFQDSMQGKLLSFEEFARHGLGQITRHYGTAPIDPVAGSRRLADRHEPLFFPLAANAHHFFVPVKVFRAQAGQFAHAQAAGIDRLQHRRVA